MTTPPSLPLRDAVPAFPFYSFAGTHRAIGEQHGEALREQIRRHLEIIYEQGHCRAGLTPGDARALAATFTPFVRDYAPGFWEEIAGLAAGAGISVEEAVLLQARQEVANVARFGRGECTTFAVSAPYTATGETLAGQNADLAGEMESIAAVIRLAPTGKPRVLMLVPAGQISYIGMNSVGLVACANFLYCPGWRSGFPRYLLTRLALEQTTLPNALTAVLHPPRASSRNLMLTSAEGDMVDVEMTAQAHSAIPAAGCQVHTNHVRAPELRRSEDAQPDELANSVCRYERMGELIEAARGHLTVAALQAACRDHANGLDAICAHPRFDGDEHTFASLIAQPATGQMWVACGTPCNHTYRSYEI